MRYKTLNDAARNSLVADVYRQTLSPGDIRIWYRKAHDPRVVDEELRTYLLDLGMGSEWIKEKGVLLPTPNNIWRSHTKLGSIAGQGRVTDVSQSGEPAVEAIYEALQGDFWSPQGEARDLIRGLGLRHTSMSMGDMIHFPDGALWMVDTFGFKKIWPKSNPRRKAKKKAARKNPDRRAILRRAMRGT